MKVFIGPYAKYCNMEGNEGTTVMAVIETSHICLHLWTDGLLQLDVYSCAPFNIKTVLNHIEVFEPVTIDYKLLDRSNDLIKLL